MQFLKVFLVINTWVWGLHTNTPVAEESSDKVDRIILVLWNEDTNRIHYRGVLNNDVFSYDQREPSKFVIGSDKNKNNKVGGHRLG